MAPMAVPLASQQTWKSLLKSGNLKIGLSMIFFFNIWKLFSATSVQWKG